MTYTADYTLNANNKWSARVRPSDTPDTTIDTGEHDDFVDCVGEVFDLVEPDAEVLVGDVRGEP
jgi:hypothetical protein